MTIALISLAVFAIVCGGMLPFLRILHSREILDHPNERSSHSAPTPTGAGLIVVPGILGGWLCLSVFGGGDIEVFNVLVVSALAIVIGLVSWIDDLTGLSASFRFSVHIVASSIATWLLPEGESVLAEFVPPYVEFVLIVLGWTWFINLFNFMDGIDGISASEGISVNLGIILLCAFASELAFLSPYSFVMIAAITGFLIWNWPPARIFLGDVGSAPLGFLMGWQLLMLANAGASAAALIIPGYYVADTTITLLHRFAKGYKFWHPHRDHFFQLAIRRGASHFRVSATVFVSGLVLSGVAVLSVTGYMLLSVFLAIAVIAVVLLLFARTAIISVKSDGEE